MARLKQVKKCRVCSSTEIVNILSLGKHYLSDFVTDNSNPNKYPLELILCTNCCLLQLKHTVSQSVLYTKRYGYRSGINKTMRNELKRIVNKSLDKIKQPKIPIVVDIGANDGTLLSYYPRFFFRIGVEPIKKLSKECKKYANAVVSDFFSYFSCFNILKHKKAHIVTAISCFYDIDDPNKFVSDIKKILHKDGIFVIQQNYLAGMLKYNAFDNIVHEHLEYYSLFSLENLVKKHNLEVFDVQLSEINGGSFRTFISHKGRRPIEQSVDKLREQEKKLKLNHKKVYKDFAVRVKKARENLCNLLVKLKKEGKSVYIYGASTRGNTLLQFCRLNNQLIKKAIERNSEKWGKKIASVGIPIISEEQARSEKPDYMLILPWFFKEEFLKREHTYLKSGGHFIFPLPTLKVI